ncbi:MAG: DUF3772 domain-containing protein [Paracoccus sp. (in: a-proteobacteria)]|uniref:DUF3772 domain-containing protein n=1 Tax=Paracoccus sp. TaxID=267 RepID=UPI0030022528
MARAFLAVLLTVLILVASPLAAQDVPKPDFGKWEQVAQQAETVVADGSSNLERLTAIRQQVFDWRRTFQQAQNVNGDRITAVKQQIEALGAPPKDGETEPSDIAARRTELNDELAKLQAPRQKAVEAASRANAIIQSIDTIRDKRKAQELARLSPSPLVPANWTLAAENAVALFEGLLSEAGPANEAGRTWSDLKPRLPSVAAYLVAALVILIFGRPWVGMLPSRLSARASEYSRAVVVFITSLGQILVPMIGTYLAIGAVKATGLPGPWTLPILEAIPAAAVILFSGGWLSRQLFPQHAIAYDTIKLADRARDTARHMVDFLATVFAVHHVLAAAILPRSGLYSSVTENRDRVPLDLAEGGASVFNFALIVLAGLALFRLGNILRRLTRRPDAGDLVYRYRILSWAGALTRIIVIVAILLGAIGFVNFANLLIWPWSLSLALIGVLIILQDFIADLFNMLKRGEEGAREGLAPLLIGFGLVILSIPVFLVIWGAKGTDLLEYWTRIESGFSFGGVTLSPGTVLTFLIVFAIGYFITRAVQGAFRNSILPKTRLDTGGQNAVVSGLGYLGIFLAAVLAITSAGIDLSSLAIVAGALSVGIGFGLQNIVSNFVSGIILLIERPVSVGDWISAGGQQGIVKKISVRATQVETFDKTEVIVPNSDLISQPVTNWTRHNKIGRIIIPVGVAYGSDTRKVEKILQEIVEDHPLVALDPAPAILFRNLGPDSLDFEIRAILADVGTGLGVTSELLHEVVRRFAEEGIEIPFAQRDIWLRNPEALPGAADTGGPAPSAAPGTAPGAPDPRVGKARTETARDLPGDGDQGDGDR